MPDCEKCPIRFECDLWKGKEISRLIDEPTMMEEMRKFLSDFCPLEELIGQAIQKRAKAKELEWELRVYE